MVTVEHGQSLFDVAIQKAGDLTSAFEFAVLNGLSITDAIPAGTQLIPAPVSEASLVNYFGNVGIIPASGQITVESSSAIGGVDFWAIGLDFTVI